MSDPPPWHRIALEELAASVAEQGCHPRILEYLATCSDLEEGESERDSTPWCSAFVNWCFAQCGIAGTDSGWARTWASWGRPIDPPRLGAVAVWARGRTSPDEPVVTGHVALVVEDRGDSLLVLGGNQSDSGWARTWASWGRPIDPPRLGAVAVWSRGRASADEPVVTGHVAFVVEDRGDSLLVLGGNQSDCVCLKTYPKRGYLTDTVDSAAPASELYELIGYRWPAP